MPSENVFNVTDGGFEKFVVRSDMPVLIDFWASWCGPCRTMAPVVDALADKYKGRILVGKVDADSETNILRAYKVDLIPTLIVFKNGLSVERMVGLKKQEEIENILEKYI